MATSIFDIKEIMPTDELVAQAVGAAKAQWDEVVSYVMASYPPVSTEWKFYSKKAGWSMLVKKKDKTVLYLIPQKNYFKVSLVLGEKAVGIAMNSGIDGTIKQLISEAVPYAEGRPFMFDIKDGKLMGDIKEIIKLKM